MQHYEEAKQIWKTMVPKSGPAACLQGELLRQIEKLRYEAQDNGNINWGSDFEYFCDFLEQTLSKEKKLPRQVRSDVRKAVSTIKRFGQSTLQYNQGKLPEEKLKKRNNGLLAFAYVDDDLYDLVVDAVVLYNRANPAAIPYSPPPDIRR